MGKSQSSGGVDWKMDKRMVVGKKSNNNYYKRKIGYLKKIIGRNGY